MSFRDGWIGACVDEYEKAIQEYQEKIERITEEDYNKIIDPVTQNNDTKSFHNITSHIVGSGFRMNILQRKALGIEGELLPNKPVPYQEIGEHLHKLLQFTFETGELMQKISDEELIQKSIQSYWGLDYNPEQLFEHMILHIHRHRRQLDKYFAGFYNQFKK